MHSYNGNSAPAVNLSPAMNFAILPCRGHCREICRLFQQGCSSHPASAGDRQTRLCSDGFVLRATCCNTAFLKLRFVVLRLGCLLASCWMTEFFRDSCSQAKSHRQITQGSAWGPFLGNDSQTTGGVHRCSGALCTPVFVTFALQLHSVLLAGLQSLQLMPRHVFKARVHRPSFPVD